MSYKMTSTNGQVQYDVNEYIIDTPEDLKSLPVKCAMGSAALCLSNGSVYIKDSTGEWKEIWLIDLITYALAKKYIKASLAGAGALKGDPGKSAYEIAVDNGYSGSETEWISSLAGVPGETPHIGSNGNWFIGAVDTGVKAGGVTSYNDLTDKPTLNGDIIEGDMEI